MSRLAQKSETLPKAKPLYAYFHGFESRHGELSQIIKLEKRINDLFPEDPKLASFSQRFIHEGFDPTIIRPIMSTSAQARPKVISSIEISTPAQNSPPAQQVQPTNSPKRPMPFEESENEATRPRKVARGESPLKGAAGRRLDQQKRSRLPNEVVQYEGQTNIHLPPPPLPRDVLFLLSIIPKASTYHATKFKPEEMVRLIRDTHIPNSVNQLRPPLPPSSNGMALPQMPQLTHSQYNGTSQDFISSHSHYTYFITATTGSTMRHGKDCYHYPLRIRSTKRRSEHQKLYSRHKDCEILGLRHSHDV